MIIYKVTNLINGKIYIGQTRKKLNRRKRKHIGNAKTETRRSAFHNAILKYGEENFRWEMIDRCMFPDMLCGLEAFYIKKYNSMSPNGYNLVCHDDCHHEISEDTRNKLRLASSGKHHSEETKKKLSIINKGKSYHKNFKHTFGIKNRCSFLPGKLHPNYGRHIYVGAENPFYGKAHSATTKERMSIAMKRKYANGWPRRGVAVKKS